FARLAVVTHMARAALHRQLVNGCWQRADRGREVDVGMAQLQRGNRIQRARRQWAPLLVEQPREVFPPRRQDRLQRRLRRCKVHDNHLIKAIFSRELFEVILHSLDRRAWRLTLTLGGRRSNTLDGRTDVKQRAGPNVLVELVQLQFQFVNQVAIQRVVVPYKLLSRREESRLPDFVATEREVIPAGKIEPSKLRQGRD